MGRLNGKGQSRDNLILALLRMKLRFGLLHLLDVFEVGSELPHSPTYQPVRMLNAVLANGANGMSDMAG